MHLRGDQQIIESWSSSCGHRLALAGGNGGMLRYLQSQKKVRGYGLESDPDNINTCINKGVNVIEKNLDHGLDNFDDRSFDTVVMTQALQAVHYPDRILEDMLRIGREAILTFPNFG